MFEPPITGLKMIGSEPTNLDRFPFFFFLSSHAVRMEARFSLLCFSRNNSTVDIAPR
jgi:hypothetical protein